MKVVLPAPLAPMSAVRTPGGQAPVMPFSSSSSLGAPGFAYSPTSSMIIVHACLHTSEATFSKMLGHDQLTLQPSVSRKDELLGKQVAAFKNYTEVLIFKSFEQPATKQPDTTGRDSHRRVVNGVKVCAGWWGQPLAWVHNNGYP